MRHFAIFKRLKSCESFFFCEIFGNENNILSRISFVAKCLM